ncbi:MAG TPA: TraR/DksA C4-type zinc finger protein [Gemmataceae bacterium]|nr:TraR/DksA C4-type zinc finger protein [Gemmataceae bacterium]
MARRDALLRLHKTLVARGEHLRRALAGELQDLRKSRETSSTGDTADAAFDSGSEELHSQLAELEARELRQIGRALARIKQGTYGLCEFCQSRIPIARLNALPYSTTCVKCQREMELSGEWDERMNGGDWEKVSDVEPLEDQREVDLSDIEMDLSGNR